MTSLVLTPASHIDSAIELSPETTMSGGLTFRLQANMRRGTGSSLHGTWSN
jgi:hypothetical protein